MSERELRSRVVSCLREAGLDAYAVENPAWPGTPDVNYRDGWIELKKVDRWPARGGPLRVECFTQQQRLWLERRCRSGGQAHLLLQVGREYLLFDGVTASAVLGHASETELRLRSQAQWASFAQLREDLPPCLRPTK